MTRTPARRRPARRTPSPSRGNGLHSLALRLELAREEERARVARELHDELGQVLTSLKLEFMWLVDQLRNSEPKPGIQLVNKLQSLIGLIEVSIQSVRQISSDLRPAVLDHLGLREAIQWEATKFEARTGIRCRVAWALKTRTGRSHAATGDVPHSAGGADQRRAARARGRGPHQRARARENADVDDSGQRARHHEGRALERRIDRPARHDRARAPAGRARDDFRVAWAWHDGDGYRSDEREAT